MEFDAGAPDPGWPGSPASRARRQGLGVARGLVNGIVFTLGLWMALTGLVLLILRR